MGAPQARWWMVAWLDDASFVGFDPGNRPRTSGPEQSELVQETGRLNQSVGQWRVHRPPA
jgi:hypothetical protein